MTTNNGWNAGWKSPTYHRYIVITITTNLHRNWLSIPTSPDALPYHFSMVQPMSRYFLIETNAFQQQFPSTILEYATTYTASFILRAMEDWSAPYAPDTELPISRNRAMGYSHHHQRSERLFQLCPTAASIALDLSQDSDTLFH
jgi:hypothetical protein